jgi:Uma2 family endonuclease
MVICGEPQFVEGRTDTVTNPKVIFEVLSESTIGRDWGDKFYTYWRLDTFEEYVLIDQYRVRVEYFRRVDETLWELRVYTKKARRIHRALFCCWYKADAIKAAPPQPLSPRRFRGRERPGPAFPLALRARSTGSQ